MVDIASLGEDAQLSGHQERHDAKRQDGDDEGVGDAVEEIGYDRLVHGYHNPPLSNHSGLISIPLE